MEALAVDVVREPLWLLLVLLAVDVDVLPCCVDEDCEGDGWEGEDGLDDDCVDGELGEDELGDDCGCVGMDEGDVGDEGDV